MDSRRKYVRYDVRNEKSFFECKIDTTLVDLIDFSMGGLYVLSKDKFLKGKPVNVSINLGGTGSINLIGKVVRTKHEPDDRWGLGIDLTCAYKLKMLSETSSNRQ